MTTDISNQGNISKYLVTWTTSDFKFIIFTIDLKTQIEALDDATVMGFVYLYKKPKYSRNLLSYIRRYVNQYSITTTYEFIIKWHDNVNWDIKHKLQIPITNSTKNWKVYIIYLALRHITYLFSKYRKCKCKKYCCFHNGVIF